MLNFESSQYKILCNLLHTANTHIDSTFSKYDLISDLEYFHIISVRIVNYILIMLLAFHANHLFGLDLAFQ